MQNKIKVTILGKVPKGDHARESFFDWKKEYIKKIKESLPEVSILHGDYVQDDVGSELVVGHDLWTIKNADIVIVDAREKIGAGTAQEMLMAKYFKKPLIAVIPPDTHHRRSNVTFNAVLIEDWVHPFLEVISDHVASSVDEAVSWTHDYLEGKIQKSIKDISIFEKAIDRFEKDLPELVSRYREQGW